MREQKRSQHTPRRRAVLSKDDGSHAGCRAATWAAPAPSSAGCAAVSPRCQFGSPDELPRIKREGAYREGLSALPDWRITCFFVDKGYRGIGVAAVALHGALQEISRLGGGTVESYPEDVNGRSVSASFLHNASTSMFEKEGFTRNRQIGKPSGSARCPSRCCPTCTDSSPIYRRNHWT